MWSIAFNFYASENSCHVAQFLDITGNRTEAAFVRENSILASKRQLGESERRPEMNMMANGGPLSINLAPVDRKHPPP